MDATAFCSNHVWKRWFWPQKLSINAPLDDKGQVDLIIPDFSKDSVPHQRLLRKLHSIGIKSKTLKWIDYFLTNRPQQVVIEGEASDKCKVTSGVPQGTVLGPLLFRVYINDLPSTIHSNVRHFADDYIVYPDITNTRDTEILQDDLDTLVKLENDWQMSFNASKCFQVRHMDLLGSPKRRTIETGVNLCQNAQKTCTFYINLAITSFDILYQTCLYLHILKM